MIQTHTTILWARPHELHIDEMADISYQILTELNAYGGELDPRYLPGRRKKDSIEFDLNIENVKQVLEKNVNKEGDTVFLELGRHIGLFSSFKEELSSSVGIRIGNSNPLFNNSVIISLPYGGFSGFDHRREEFEALLKRIIAIFKPYFAFVENSLNNQLSDEFWSKKKNKPTYVHWMNYYDKATSKAIGKNRLVKPGQCEPLGDGYFLKLQDMPIDINNPEQLENQRQVSKQLRLL